MKRQMKHMRWRLFTVLAVLAIAGVPAWAQYGGGTGTADDPYLIETAEQLNAIGLNSPDFDKHFRLTANIDMNDLAGAKVNLIPVFGGVFDGNGHTIANLTYLVTEEDLMTETPYIMWIGLFRLIAGLDTVVKDLGLINPDLRPAPTCTMEVRYVGALVGTLVEGWVRNCYVEGGRVAGRICVGGLIGSCHDTAVSESWSSAEVSGSLDIGGLVGRCSGPVDLWLCHAAARVSGWENIGGLVGDCTLDGIIKDCFTTGTVQAELQAGGLVGTLGGSVLNCHSTARVSGDATLGGLVGVNWGLIRTSWAGGDVVGRRAVGGLVGSCMVGDGRYVPFFNTTVADSYATGAVRGADVIGGLIASNYGNVLRCYARGAVAASKKDGIVGGLVAVDDSLAAWDVRDSFWDTTTTGVTVSDGGTGKTTAEMQNPATYIAAGWDLAGETANGTEDLWKMTGDPPAYPKLAWEEGP